MEGCNSWVRSESIEVLSLYHESVSSLRDQTVENVLMERRNILSIVSKYEVSIKTIIDVHFVTGDCTSRKLVVSIENPLNRDWGLSWEVENLGGCCRLIRKISKCSWNYWGTGRISLLVERCYIEPVNQSHDNSRIISKIKNETSWLAIITCNLLISTLISIVSVKLVSSNRSSAVVCWRPYRDLNVERCSCYNSWLRWLAWSHCSKDVSNGRVVSPSDDIPHSVPCSVESSSLHPAVLCVGGCKRVDKDAEHCHELTSLTIVYFKRVAKHGSPSVLCNCKWLDVNFDYCGAGYSLIRSWSN